MKKSWPNGESVSLDLLKSVFNKIADAKVKLQIGNLALDGGFNKCASLSYVRSERAFFEHEIAHHVGVLFSVGQAHGLSAFINDCACRMVLQVPANPRQVADDWNIHLAQIFCRSNA